jgi:hypothetical protein
VTCSPRRPNGHTWRALQYSSSSISRVSDDADIINPQITFGFG